MRREPITEERRRRPITEKRTPKSKSKSTHRKVPLTPSHIECQIKYTKALYLADRAEKSVVLAA
jgi:hypothetical protein